MLKHDITYEDYDGNQVTDELYFNVTKSELVELEVEHPEGMSQWVDNVIKANDKKALIAEFKKIILFAYGKKSPDGKRFIKNDELREEFAQTAAYDALFLRLATDDKFSATFIKGILPKDLIEDAEKEIEAAKSAAKKADEETVSAPDA